ncbi:hypothetical protein AB1L88_26445 [Tautonia sp. JC769]|uniref:hypothetical protein n=1 Tax=Tautonia sp. JC769 TaxID=3232135 RepID=UPI0034576449
MTIGTAMAAPLLGGLVILTPLGAGRIARAQETPTVGRLQEPSPRGEAARQIAELLRNGVDVDPQEVIDSMPSLEALATRRSEIAEELMEFSLVKFLEPPSPTAQRGTFHAAIEDYMTWSSHRLDAALDLTPSLDDRRNVIAQEVAKIRRVEEIYRELTETRGVGVTQQNLLELEFKRLQLETRLAHELRTEGN